MTPTEIEQGDELDAELMELRDSYRAFKRRAAPWLALTALALCAAIARAGGE